MQPTLPITHRLLLPFLRLFFRLLYHQMAWSYDLVAAAVSVGMWKQWVMAVIPHLAGPKVLELGHGPGHLQLGLRKDPHLAWQVFGLDRSLQMGRQAGRRLRKAGYSPCLVNGQAQALPYPAGAFDSVAATFPTEYLVHPDTLAEIHRVLKPGGRLVVLPTAYITGRRLSHRLAARLFQVTGQAPRVDEQSLTPVRQAGFIPTSHWVEHPDYKLLVVTALKTG